MTDRSLLMPSPVGTIELTSDGESITHLRFVDDVPGPADDADGHVDDPVLDDARRQLQQYFAGGLEEFDLPLAPTGTAFQQRVWSELRKIPYGVTASYGDIAHRLGMPAGASRAVGLANGANPIAIAVPCHRVIGANGTLVGYAGGLHRKRYLLDLEAQSVQPGLFA